MEAHARVHARHQSYHSRTTQFSSPLEVQKQTKTLLQRATTIELTKRATSSNANSLTSGVNPTIPIVVGICVPLAVIIVTFIWLHRRHVKRTRAEERADPHKSLDFGLGNKTGSSRGAKEMAVMDFEKTIRRGRGLSMDIGSPYLLPLELHNSRESLNSLSRNIVHEAHDPYRPVITFLSTAPNSARNSIAHDDAASIGSGSTMRKQRTEGISSPLVPNAQRMPFSSSPALHSTGEMPKSQSRAQTRSPLSSPPIEHSQPNMSQFVPPPPIAHRDSLKSISPKSTLNSQSSQYQREQIPAVHVQSFHVPEEPKNPQVLPMPAYPGPTPVPQTQYQNGEYDDDYYDESHYIRQPIRQHPSSALPYSTSSDQFYTPSEEHQNFQHHPSDFHPDGLGVSNMPVDSRRTSVLRPLPPDDPSDTPQQRAQRIRSFYKEYFNDHEGRVYQQTGNDYYEDYGQEFVGGNAMYDSHGGQFVVESAPYAEHITRRAMTPPPRGPPRFSDHHNRIGSSQGGPYRARAFSTVSAGGFRGPAPKHYAPPPAPLRTLPTPHLLREDAFSLPIDFAPPTSVRDQAAGRSASPRMEPRPFSPQVAIASPLTSSFNELPVMPSPHALRSSGTFTGLDFAPPPRFRDRDNASDAGSIRSGRSNHSTSSRMQVQNIRAGTYRVSRIPKELVGTQNEFSEILKPTWKVGS